jgi:hypothetical protein
MNQQSLPATRIVSQSPRTDMPFLARYNDEATSPAPGFCSWDPFLARMGTATMALRYTSTPIGRSWYDHVSGGAGA